MKKENKALLRISVFLLIVIVVCAATYAYLSINETFYGNFDVEIQTKDVDIFETKNIKDAIITVNGTNFGPETGTSQSDSAILAVELSSSKKPSSVCYQILLDLPDEKVFTYTREDKTPELTVTLSKSSDNKTYTPVVQNIDITEATGDYMLADNQKISTDGKKKTTDYWKADVTFVWLKDDLQDVNDKKSYESSLKAAYVEC